MRGAQVRAVQPMIACGCTITHVRATPCGCACHSGERSAYLTPAELADLAVIRERALADAGDMAPMLSVSYDELGQRVERRIPWLVALNMEV